jgi:myxalamid-type polyketide synthase MxaE and MxaD
LSVNWGFWAGGGITGDEEGRFFRQIGLEMIPSGQAFSALEVLLGEGAIQGTVADVRWEVFKPIYESRGRRPFLAEIDPGVVVDAGTQGVRSDLLERLATARPGDRGELLAIHVATSVAAILGFDSVAAIERQRGFFKMGMDSIMTVQLRNRLERELGRKLPPTVAFEYPTVDALAAFLVGEMFPSASPPPAAPDEVKATEAEDLSEDELTVLLAERLRQSR